MNNFWSQAGWMLLGVFLAAGAILMFVLGFMRLIDAHWISSIFLIIGSIIAAVFSIAAFKQL